MVGISEKHPKQKDDVLNAITFFLLSLAAASNFFLLSNKRITQSANRMRLKRVYKVLKGNTYMYFLSGSGVFVCLFDWFGFVGFFHSF